MVIGYDPVCFINQIDNLLQNSFNNDLLPQLCNCDYNYYIVNGSMPTKYFYSLELIGDVDDTELQFRYWIEQALLNSWSDLYPGKG